MLILVAFSNRTPLTRLWTFPLPLQTVSSGSVPTANDLAQSRLTKVFKYLKELNELRNPVLRDMSAYPEVLRLDAWPAHPCIDVRREDDSRKQRLTSLLAIPR